MARKEGSPILLLLLVRVGHSVRTIMLGVAGGVSQRLAYDLLIGHIDHMMHRMIGVPFLGLYRSV